MHKTFGEDRTCSSGNMLADRMADRHTRHYSQQNRVRVCRLRDARDSERIAWVEESFIDRIFELRIKNGFHEDFVANHVVSVAFTLQHTTSSMSTKLVHTTTAEHICCNTIY